MVADFGEARLRELFVMVDDLAGNRVAEDVILVGVADEHHAVLYGTLNSQILEKQEHSHVILDIEPNGAFNVRAKRPDATLIFIMPPSREELERRLRSRGDTPEDQIKVRLERARWDMEQSKKYDYIVINDQVEACADEILRIIEK